MLGLHDLSHGCLFYDVWSDPRSLVPRLSFTPEMQSRDICLSVSRICAGASLSSLHNMKSLFLLLLLVRHTVVPADCKQSRNWGHQTRAADCLPPNEGVAFLCSTNQTRIGKIGNGVECETTCDTAKFKFTCSDGEWIYSHTDLHNYPPCLFAFRCKYLRDTSNKAKLAIVREARIGDWPVPFFGTVIRVDCLRDGNNVRKVCRPDGTWSGPPLDCMEEVSFDQVLPNVDYGSRHTTLVWSLAAACCFGLLLSIYLAIKIKKISDGYLEPTRQQGIRTYIRKRRFEKHSILLFANPTYGQFMAPEPLLK